MRIVREGAVKGAGKYLWEAAPQIQDWSLAGGAGVFTSGGGSWLTKSTVYIPWWDEPQSGAKVFTDRREGGSKAGGDATSKASTAIAASDSSGRTCAELSAVGS